jgi:hypothetical protein
MATVLFVVGMVRSGTSALTRVLSLSGGTLPPGMIGGMPGNPLGYWEPRKTNFLNDAILRRHGSTAIDPSLRLQEEGALSADERAACIAKIHEYLTTVAPTPLLVVKDLHITALSDMWFEAARLAGYDPMAVISVRHPEEVIASLSVMRRYQPPPALSAALWLKYSLLAEKHTRAMPRVFVEYSNLLKDWRREVKRISAALRVDLDMGNGAVDEFLHSDLRHHQHCGPATEFFGTDWMSTVYRQLHLAAHDVPWDQCDLDRVLSVYRACEHGFRTAHEGVRRAGRLNLLVRPFARPALEVLAVAHRRRGTWA